MMSVDLTFLVSLFYFSSRAAFNYELSLFVVKNLCYIFMLIHSLYPGKKMEQKKPSMASTFLSECRFIFLCSFSLGMVHLFQRFCCRSRRRGIPREPLSVQFLSEDQIEMEAVRQTERGARSSLSEGESLSFKIRHKTFCEVHTFNLLFS